MTKHYAFSGNDLVDSIVFSIQNENGNYNNYNYHFNPMQFNKRLDTYMDTNNVCRIFTTK